MKDITPILSSLGLQDSEISTYLKALENGPSTVVELSKLTKYSRQGSYTAIESLSERGLMASVVRGKKKLYVAEPPSKLLAYAKRRDEEMHDRVKDLERLVPELELQSGGERPIVRMFEGKDGLRAIIEDMKNATEGNSVEITDVNAMKKVLSDEDLENMRKTISKKGTKVRGIYAGTIGTKNPTAAERNLLPAKYSNFKSNIGIYGDKIALVTFEGKMHSVLVESKALAKALRILFELAFKGQKK